MNDSKNPLSPHLQIYRWQVSSLVSITHRITGILNLLGLIFICAWISSAGIGENLFECFALFLKSFIGKFILIGFTWSMSYHLLSGIRHFFWDLGYGYEIKDGGYITPVESSGDFVTYISRIREDKTQKNSINMWVVSDNLLKGAALNAVQIANVLIKKYIN